MKLKGLWLGNDVEPTADVVSDGHMIFYRHAVLDSKLLKRLERPSRRAARAGYIPARTALLKLSGNTHRRARRLPAQALADPSGGIIPVNEIWYATPAVTIRVPADQLELMRLLLDWDAVRADDPLGVLRLYRSGRLVAGISAMAPAPDPSDVAKLTRRD